MTDELRTNPFLSLAPRPDDTHELLLVDAYANEYQNISDPRVYRLLTDAAEGIDRPSLVERTARLFDYATERAESLASRQIPWR